MKHLIVYSHPNPQSFNHAILDVYQGALIEQGHEVKVRDLYAMDFDPVLSAQDLAMSRTKEYAPDVRAEHECVRWADVITLICPIWWGGLTSNLRGYIDRVFSVGFAYDFGPGGLQRLLTGKKAILINTMGEAYAVYQRTGMLASMTQTVDTCMTDFTGIEIVDHLYFGNVVGCPPEERALMLDRVAQLAARING